VEKSPDNGRAIVAALRELGFDLDDLQAAQIERGKDFVQLKNGPFDLDLVFAPAGIERFADAWRRHVEVEGFSALTAQAGARRIPPETVYEPETSIKSEKVALNSGEAAINSSSLSINRIAGAQKCFGTAIN
jgi:hypothetical protein